VGSVVGDSVTSWSAGEDFQVYPALKQLTLDVATKIFMASALGGEATKLTRAFVDTVRAGTSLVRVPVPGGRWAAGLSGRKVLEDYFRRSLPAKRASDSDDLFAALCHARTDEGETFSDDDVVNHMIFLMMAAHDTSTITATAMSYYFAKHREWQDKARAESLALGTPTPTIDELESLATLDLVFKEAMRLVAPVPALVRRATEDTGLVGRYVPKGTMVVVAPGAIHTVGDHWVSVSKFDPLRHAEPRNEHKTHRYGYVPFGGGAHKCIGMAFGTNEVKALMHAMLTTYELEIPDDYEIEWDHTSLVMPTDNFPVTLRPLAAVAL
jgi:cytochrome P450